MRRSYRSSRRLCYDVFRTKCHFTGTAPTGTHLSPQEFHSAMMDPDTVVIDVRNFNETVLGKFAPAQVLESSGEGGGEYSGWLRLRCEALRKR
jgi:hypothetical protein